MKKKRANDDEKMKETSEESGKKKAKRPPKPSRSTKKHDVFSATKRSKIMSGVRSTSNRSTELRFLDELKRLKITGWRRQVNIVGKPDFLFRQLRIAIFVDGCFWHGHDCRNVTPKDHAEYWRAKVERNKARDREVTSRLEARGYTVIRIWECDLKKKNAERLAEKLLPLIRAFQAKRENLDEETRKRECSNS